MIMLFPTGIWTTENQETAYVAFQLADAKLALAGLCKYTSNSMPPLLLEIAI